MKSYRFNYNHLFVFYLVGKYSSLSEAARIQKVPKPSLSAQIKKLEKDLQTTLFAREGKGMKLTYDGQRVYSYASKMFELSEVMLRTLSAKSRQNKKAIVIGITPTISLYYSVTSMMPLFQAKSFVPVIREGRLDYLVDELVKHNIDLIINEEQAALIPLDLGHVESTPIGFNNYVFVGSKKYQSASKRFPRCLAKAPFFNYTPTNPIREKLDHFFFHHGLSVELYGETNSIEMIRAATLSGQCLSALPEWAVSGYQKQLFRLGNFESGFEKINATYRSKDDFEKIEKIIRVLKLTT